MPVDHPWVAHGSLVGRPWHNGSTSLMARAWVTHEFMALPHGSRKGHPSVTRGSPIGRPLLIGPSPWVSHGSRVGHPSSPWVTRGSSVGHPWAAHGYRDVFYEVLVAHRWRNGHPCVTHEVMESRQHSHIGHSWGTSWPPLNPTWFTRSSSRGTRRSPVGRSWVVHGPVVGSWVECASP